MAITRFSSKANSKKKPIISDINITPFVDVLLVLLIIFMITAPLLTSGVNVDLPQGAGNKIEEKSPPIIVAIKQDGSIYLQDESLKISQLAAKLLTLSDNNLNNKIYIKADKALDYGRVMEVVKNINLAGFKQVILVTELVN